MQAHAGPLLPSVPHCALRLHSMMVHFSLRTLPAMHSVIINVQWYAIYW